MKSLLNRLVREEEGQDLIEYALLAAFISLACIVAMKLVATGLSTLFTKVSTDLNTAAISIRVRAASCVSAARRSNKFRANQYTPPTAAVPRTALSTKPQPAGGSPPPIQNSGASTSG